jgi:hypothetical protein
VFSSAFVSSNQALRMGNKDYLAERLNGGEQMKIERQ